MTPEQERQREEELKRMKETNPPKNKPTVERLSAVMLEYVMLLFYHVFIIESVVY